MRRSTACAAEISRTVIHRPVSRFGQSPFGWWIDPNRHGLLPFVQYGMKDDKPHYCDENTLNEKHGGASPSPLRGRWVDNLSRNGSSLAGGSPARGQRCCFFRAASCRLLLHDRHGPCGKTCCYFSAKPFFEGLPETFLSNKCVRFASTDCPTFQESTPPPCGRCISWTSPGTAGVTQKLKVER